MPGELWHPSTLGPIKNILKTCVVCSSEIHHHSLLHLHAFTLLGSLSYSVTLRTLVWSFENSRWTDQNWTALAKLFSSITTLEKILIGFAGGLDGEIADFRYSRDQKSSTTRFVESPSILEKLTLAHYEYLASALATPELSKGRWYEIDPGSFEPTGMLCT